MSLETLPNILYKLSGKLTSSESLALAVGQNCSRIRSDAGVTQDGLAKCARGIGLRWTASAVGDFEAGRSAPTFATVLAATLALNMALQESGQPGGTTLADLVAPGVAAGERFVALTDSIDVLDTLLVQVCQGQEFRLHEGKWRPKLQPLGWRETQAMLDGLGDVREILERSGLTEHRLAQRLGTDHAHIAKLSLRLWQRTFSDERDRRAGADANQQKKGRISRELRAELERALTDGND